MTRMSTVHSGFPCGSGTTPADCGVSAKACAETVKTAKETSWMLTGRIAGSSLGSWAIIVGIACTAITYTVNWYYRKKEREDRLNDNVTKTEE